MVKLSIYAALLLVAFAFVLVCWQVGRQINYSYAYEDMVRRTVVEMVKPEALKGE